MNTHLSIWQQTALPAPKDIAAYLLGKGWAHKTQDNRWAIYETLLSGEKISIEVPLRVHASDYSKAVQTLVDDLAHVTQSKPGHIIQAILESSIDIVRLKLKSPHTENGRVPVAAGARAYSATRDLVLAAACAAREPRAVFPKRKPTEAMDYLQKARFGLAEIGSYVLTVETPVPPQLKSFNRTEENFVDEPFERKASIAFANCMSESLKAAEEAQTSQTLEPFVKRISKGVSANFCEALVDLMDSTAIETLAVDFSFAVNRPILQPISSLLFSSDLKDIFQEAAKSLREEAPLNETEIKGPIRKLERGRPDPTLPGEITVYAEVEGKMRSIKILVDASTYSQAIKAHEQGYLVYCTGDLKQHTTGLILENLRNFLIIEGD